MFHRSSGIGLLELMLSLTVIAILLVTATRYYSVTRSAQETNDAFSMLQAVYSAAETWKQDYGKFPDNNLIEHFIDVGSLPTVFGTKNANPWGGEITAFPIKESPNDFAACLCNVPKDACMNLLQKYQLQMSGQVYPSCGNSDCSCVSKSDGTSFYVQYYDETH